MTPTTFALQKPSLRNKVESTRPGGFDSLPPPNNSCTATAPYRKDKLVKASSCVSQVWRSPKSLTRPWFAHTLLNDFVDVIFETKNFNNFTLLITYLSHLQTGLECNELILLNIRFQDRLRTVDFIKLAAPHTLHFFFLFLAHDLRHDSFLLNFKNSATVH